MSWDQTVTPALLQLKDCGELTDDTTITQFQSVVGRQVIFIANAANTNPVAIGLSDVTLPGNTTDTTSGFPLAAGEMTPPLPLGPDGNLDAYYLVATTSGEGVSWLVFG